MELSSGVKQGNIVIKLQQMMQIVALTTRGPNVTVLAHAESPTGASALGSPHQLRFARRTCGPCRLSSGALNIVVTIPVLKDLTEQVGGSHVRVTSLLSGYENEHTYSLNRAISSLSGKHGCCSKSVSVSKSGSPRW